MKKLLFLLCILDVGLASAQRIPIANPALCPFYYGVASGDPLSDRVILWTRISPDSSSTTSLTVHWEMSENLNFDLIVNQGDTITDSTKDWTVKIDANGLLPNKTYYYRFRAPDGTYSIIGRTKTAPIDTKENIRLAVVSCSSIYSGYFNAYKRIAERADLDAVIHLGDYIYDFVDMDEANRVRPIDTTRILTTLADFRSVHAYYHLDPDLRAAHQQHPFIILWDNHDISWSRSDSLSLPKYEGAIQAFYEWTPIREPLDRKKMYRYFSYGGLADIVLTDVTHFRQKPFSPPASNGSDDPNRKLWGDEQYTWLTDKLLNSLAKWKIVGSEKQFGQWDLIGLPFGTGQGIAFASLLSEGDVNEYNADRVRFLKFLRDNHIDNTIVISGDLHFSFAMDLSENPFNPLYYNAGTGDKSVAVEFQPTSVTRVNLDEKTKGLLPASIVTGLTQISTQLNPHHRYEDLVQHGYGILDLRSEKATGEFWYCNKLIVDTVQKMDAAFELYDRVNHWSRRRLSIPSVPLLPSAPLAPFNITTAIKYTRNTDIGIQVFPNPANNMTTLKITTPKHNIPIVVQLVSIATGAMLKEVYKGEVHEEKYLHVDVSDIPAQTVLVVISSNNNELVYSKLNIIKE